MLICSAQPGVVAEVRKFLTEKHVEHYMIDAAIFRNHIDELQECYDCFVDEKSKQVYAELVRARITDASVSPAIKEENQYFALDIFQAASADEVFVDCGAYTGDTILEYLRNKNGRFGKIVAFEPDDTSFAQLKNTVQHETADRGFSENKIAIYPYGIADKSNVLKLVQRENVPTSNKLVDADDAVGTEIKVVSIDEFIDEPIHFLKADIESFEYKLLIGAEQTIKKYRPKLAICIYHNGVDFFQIPRLIKKMVPEYHIAVRHHTHDLSETVLYAWV